VFLLWHAYSAFFLLSHPLNLEPNNPFSPRVLRPTKEKDPSFYFPPPVTLQSTVSSRRTTQTTPSPLHFPTQGDPPHPKSALLASAFFLLYCTFSPVTPRGIGSCFPFFFFHATKVPPIPPFQLFFFRLDFSFFDSFEPCELTLTWRSSSFLDFSVGRKMEVLGLVELLFGALRCSISPLELKCTGSLFPSPFLLGNLSTPPNGFSTGAALIC